MTSCKNASVLTIVTLQCMCAIFMGACGTDVNTGTGTPDRRLDEAIIERLNQRLGTPDASDATPIPDSITARPFDVPDLESAANLLPWRFMYQEDWEPFAVGRPTLTFGNHDHELELLYAKEGLTFRMIQFVAKHREITDAAGAEKEYVGSREVWFLEESGEATAIVKSGIEHESEPVVAIVVTDGSREDLERFVSGLREFDLSRASPF